LLHIDYQTMRVLCCQHQSLFAHVQLQTSAPTLATCFVALLAAAACVKGRRHLFPSSSYHTLLLVLSLQPLLQASKNACNAMTDQAPPAALSNHLLAAAAFVQGWPHLSFHVNSVNSSTGDHMLLPLLLLLLQVLLLLLDVSAATWEK
jgi:hypothetical protein